jgi:hypothetical protein
VREAITRCGRRDPPTSEAALGEAEFRESNVLPPCKAIVINDRGEQVKTGCRDAAIWLTAVEYAREHPEKTVYFVSRDTKDFGDAGRRHRVHEGAHSAGSSTASLGGIWMPAWTSTCRPGRLGDRPRPDGGELVFEGTPTNSCRAKKAFAGKHLRRAVRADFNVPT